ncbi:MAG: ABC transporter substrate-binding protein [Anaerolineaceae bacterium]|nr:ABC transporter substrate-binding protein [Anaerolineaceae bacterium]
MKKLISFVIFFSVFLAGCMHQTPQDIQQITPTPVSTQVMAPSACAQNQSCKQEPIQTYPASSATAEVKPSQNSQNELPQPAAFIVKDALGRAFSFQKIPERIILLGKDAFILADAVYAFPDAGSRILALSPLPAAKAEFLSIIDPQFTAKKILDEKVVPAEIAALKPDCVILKPAEEQLGEALDALDIPVIYLEFETFEQYDRDLETLGNLLGEQDRAIKLRAFYRTYLADVRKYFKEASPDELPKVLFLRYSEQNGAINLSIPAPDSIQSALIENAGGVPVWKEDAIGEASTDLGVEQISAWNPDFIFVSTSNQKTLEAVSKLRNDPQLKASELLKKTSIRPMLGDFSPYDSADTRWSLGLLWITRTLHPSKIWPLDFYEAARNFYSTFYRMDTKTYEQTIKPLLRPYFK